MTGRHADKNAVDDTVTATEWLAAHQEATDAEDPHREITSEYELADVSWERAEDVEAVATAEPERDVETAAPEPIAETERPDLREVAADEPAQSHEDTVRVPSSNETAESVERAQRALAEIAEREAAEKEREAEEAQAAQEAHWHAEDETAEQSAEREAEHAGPELEPVGR